MLQIITPERTRRLFLSVFVFESTAIEMFGWVIWKLQLPRFRDSWPRLYVAYQVPAVGVVRLKCELQSLKYLPNPRRKKVGLAIGNSTVLKEEPPGEPLRSCHVGHRSPHERAVKIRQYLLFQKTQHYVASLPLHPVTWQG